METREVRLTRRDLLRRAVAVPVFGAGVVCMNLAVERETPLTELLDLKVYIDAHSDNTQHLSVRDFLETTAITLVGLLPLKSGLNDFLKRLNIPSETRYEPQEKIENNLKQARLKTYFKMCFVAP